MKYLEIWEIVDTSSIFVKYKKILFRILSDKKYTYLLPVRSLLLESFCSNSCSKIDWQMSIVSLKRKRLKDAYSFFNCKFALREIGSNNPKIEFETNNGISQFDFS